ncbi:hypothetical protein [Kordia sp.]|uniref:hypothetical protein n=1 Tax=Kordia sp. TaxID=1965332 RepID=UPI0025BD02E2|nr:hypothetical protein [Kordia sp.]MCH2193786.1 hypothetical protein [Kordia sp.]
MKKVLVVALGLFLIACGSEEKKKTGEEPKQQETKKPEEKKPTEKELAIMALPEISKLSAEPLIIHEDIHEFSDDIQFEEVGVVKGSTDGTHSFLFYVGDNTDLQALSQYTLAVMLYPENPKELAKKDQKKGFMVKSTKCKVMREGKYPVVMFADYPANVTKVKEVKAYLYTKDGILNPKKQKLLIKNFSL